MLGPQPFDRERDLVSALLRICEPFWGRGFREFPVGYGRQRKGALRIDLLFPMVGVFVEAKLPGRPFSGGFRQVGVYAELLYRSRGIGGFWVGCVSDGSRFVWSLFDDGLMVVEGGWAECGLGGLRSVGIRDRGLGGVGLGGWGWLGLSVKNVVSEDGSLGRVCSDCRVAKPVGGFSPSGHRSGGLANRCKGCMAALNRSRYHSDGSYRAEKLRVDRERFSRRYRSDPVFRERFLARDRERRGLG